MTRLRQYLSVLLRPWAAAVMLVAHRRTLLYLAVKRRWRNLYNFIFVTFFIRGEDCGKGVADPLWKFAPGWSSGHLFGWDIEVEITTKCYLKCIMCESPHFPPEYKQNLSLEQFKTLIDTTPSLKWINLTGEGSAFLNPDFMEMLRYVKGKGIYVDFSHDFFRLSLGQMIDLIDMGIERVYWSVDGCTKESYERIRVGADFAHVLANIQKFVGMKIIKRRPLPELCVRYTFMKGNVHELPLLIPMLERIAPAKEWGDQPAVNIVALLDFPETAHLVAEVSPETVALVNSQAKKAGWTTYWSHVTHDESAKPPMHYCTFWSEPYVMVTGHVVPCCGVLMSNRRPFLEQHAFGNIRDLSLRNIWDTDRYQAFRRSVVSRTAPVPILCEGCRSFNTADRVAKYGVSEWV